MWKHFVIAFLTTFGLGIVAVLGFIVLIDPYDSGRFGAGWISGVVDEDPRTAAVSRGRDPRFDSAVFGNSHGQLLDPLRLSSTSGQNFVQLTVPGTGPREQLTLLHWFVRHHARIGAIVLVTDSYWCTQDSSLPISNPFPFWLYSEANLEYAVNALRTAALNRGWRRLLLAVGLRQRSDPAGYLDYERGRVWAFTPTIPEGLEPEVAIREGERRFPAIERLWAQLGERAREVPIIVVFPPAFVTQLPKSGSAEGHLTAECKGALARLAQERGAFIDFAVDGELARDPMNFMDATHYRAGVAREIEARIVAALAQVRR